MKLPFLSLNTDVVTTIVPTIYPSIKPTIASAVVSALTLALSAPAHAQLTPSQYSATEFTTTLYGVLDAGVRYSDG